MDRDSTGRLATQKQNSHNGDTSGIRRGALFFVLATSFLNLMGVSIIAPVAPYLAQRYGADAFTVGLLFAANSFFQFLAMPGLGALSDRYGRRPILLLSLFGSAVGYLLFGLGGALWVLFFSRILDGVTSGDVGAILAYIADISDPEDRIKYYGWIGAVSGFGFVVGPAIGGLLSRMSYEAPFYAVAAITFANTLWGLVQLPESLPPE